MKIKNQTPTKTPGVPEIIDSKFGGQITGILSGFDRVRFRATLRLLFQAAAMETYLQACGMLIKEFKDFAERSRSASGRRRRLRVARCATLPPRNNRRKSRGEFALNGLRNRDLRALLYPAASIAADKKRQSATITRQLALLRAHGVLKKVSGTHRWLLTDYSLRS
jgi:hypothetical protein